MKTITWRGRPLFWALKGPRSRTWLCCENGVTLNKVTVLFWQFKPNLLMRSKKVNYISKVQDTTLDSLANSSGHDDFPLILHLSENEVFGGSGTTEFASPHTTTGPSRGVTTTLPTPVVCQTSQKSIGAPENFVSLEELDIDMAR